MTSKVIEGHKSSSNFSVNPTLPLLDCLLMLPPQNCVKISHSLSCSLFPSLSWIRLYADVFLSGSCLHFIPPFGRFYEELKEKSSLSLYLLPFTVSLSMPLPFTLYLYISLSPLSLISLSLYIFSPSLALSPSLSLFSLSFSLAYLMDIFVLNHEATVNFLKFHIFWSNYNRDLRSYGKLLSLFLFDRGIFLFYWNLKVLMMTIIISFKDLYYVLAFLHKIKD